MNKHPELDVWFCEEDGSLSRTAKIDPSLIPDSVYDIASRTLDRCIRKALQNPDTRQEFENWKKNRSKEEALLKRRR